MPVIKELIRTESNHALSFGDYTLEQKTKITDYEFQGDIYKIKTFREITKLKRNGLLVYESTPGTAVNGFRETADLVEFKVEGPEDAQITLELEPEQSYEILLNDESHGRVTTNLGGKLMLSVSLEEGKAVWVRVVRNGAMSEQ